MRWCTGTAVAGDAFTPQPGHESDGAVAHPGHPACGDPRRAQRDRSPLSRPTPRDCPRRRRPLPTPQWPQRRATSSSALLPDQAALVESRVRPRPRWPCATAPPRPPASPPARPPPAATMNRRQGDGADDAAQPVYVPRAGPGEYQFTAPFNFAAQPGWGRVQPFVIDLREHAVDGPQAFDQRARTRATWPRSRRSATSTARRARPSNRRSRQFWYEDSPLGWNRIANAVVRQRRLDAWEAARAFALVHFAMADGFIAGFDAKYEHRFWRPVTAIHAAATDGNPLTRGRRRVAAVPDDAAGAGLPVDAHGARLGRRRGADRALRRQGALQR